ncbi:murein hydrolase activator EnvC family protein [Guyparkeria sp.]|uniref:murein hydrolase activator EnvC family protein n=1 Tax=Guyparkeria sp. TaxID=2035736 RepID=UPI00356B1786
MTRPNFLAILWMATAGWCLVVPAPTSAAQIEQEIESQREEIETTRAERERARKELERHEEALADLDKHAQALDERRGELEQQREALDIREAELREGLAERQAELESRLRSAYPLTRGGALQALLAEGDSLQARRDLQYLKATIEPIQRARESLARQQAALEDNRQEIQANDEKLREAGEALESNYRQVAENLDRQETLLASLGEALDQQQADLRSLLERKERLDREVRAAQARKEAEARKEKEAQARADEARQKAGGDGEKTPIPSGGIPIAGSVMRGYGDSLPNGRLRHEGIAFRAERGQPVRAVDSGTVVYAASLKGWGKLVMLRHRDSYLSLYAHCQTLNVEKGARVDQGEQLCESGVMDAGQAGLYVEVRHNNRPVNPGRWPAWRKVAGG